MIDKRGQYKLSFLPLSANTRKRPHVVSSMEKVQYWHVLHKFSIDTFLTRYCKVYLSQYKLKEERPKELGGTAKLRCVSSPQRGDIQTRHKHNQFTDARPLAIAALPTQDAFVCF